MNSQKERIYETIFMVIRYISVVLFFAFDKQNPGISFQQLCFFSTYAIAALAISYIFLPRFFYKQKMIQFLIAILLILAIVIAVEELILEQIFFAGTRRAQHFPGIAYNLIDTLPAISILSGAKFAWDALRKQKKLDEMQVLFEESELQFLKSQINPHFLFNNLNNLYSYALESNPKTPEIILGLSGMLRYMLYDCQEEYVSLSKEIEHIENFIQLNELQIEERGEVHFTKTVDNAYHKIAPLILIVFIENAFKHSTGSQAGGIKIAIDINVTENNQLDFKCLNTFEEQSNTDSLSNGIGLENAKKRLNLTYPQKHNLQINQKDGKFMVHLTLDLQV